MSALQEQEEWSLIIKPTRSIWNLRFNEVWRYKDLLMLFVRRDFVSIYKQTILGPLWFFVQPVLTTLTFTIIFGRLANISTDGMPSVIFYMAGIVLWNYFSECFNKTSSTFTTNQGLFGKVYFPRIIVPLSVIINNLLKLVIQLALFVCFYIYYFSLTDSPLNPNPYLLLLPFLIIIVAFLGLGFGMIISSLTTKYKDLTFLVGFGTQLLMYASPVVYPLSIVPEDKRWMLVANPMTSVIETFKFAFLGTGIFSWAYLFYSVLFCIILFFAGVIVFNSVEKSFIDTV